MNIKMFYHSVISDWNHGNVHFIRGIITALQADHHRVTIFEPENGWSLRNLIKYQGNRVVDDFRKKFPRHMPEFYRVDDFDPEKVLSDADLVIVHEWNEPELVKKIGEYRSSNDDFILLFHDTHHRAVSRPEQMQKYDLRHFDGVLVFGDVLRNIYLREGWAENVWTWHEAADTTLFYPYPQQEKEGDLVWVGNWGDDERTEELMEFIIDPVRELKLKTVFYGVRYPSHAIKSLKKAGIEYRGWLPNYNVPRVFSQFRATVHVPRRPYVDKLPGIPTIRPFEAMASGIPLVSSIWHDTERLFNPGRDYLLAVDGKEMKACLERVLCRSDEAEILTRNALDNIRQRHTCSHRVRELMEIVNKLQMKVSNLETKD